MKEKLGKYINEFQDIFFNEKKNNFEIYNAYDINYQKDVSLKFMKKEDCPNYDLFMKNLDNQKKILNLCKSENIQSLYRILETEKYIILEMEGYDENLHQYIMNNGPSDTEKEFFKSIALGLGRALQVLYNNKVIHRNIKSSHVFLTKEKGEYSVKLGEFNSAIFIRNNTSESLNSYYYAAPEIINGEKYNEKCDIWSYGIVLYDLYFGDLPYGYKPSKNKIIKAISDEKNFIIKETGIPTLDQLFKYTLKINPNERYSHQQVLKLIFSHKFMKKGEKIDSHIPNNEVVSNNDNKISFIDKENLIPIINNDNENLISNNYIKLNLNNNALKKNDNTKNKKAILMSTKDEITKNCIKNSFNDKENLIPNNDVIIQCDNKNENENKVNDSNNYDKIKKIIFGTMITLVGGVGIYALFLLL